MIDPTVTLGNLLTVVSMIAAAGFYIVDTRSRANALKESFGELRTSLSGLSTNVAEHMKEDDSQFAIMRRELGETGHALRQKIHEVELFASENYVRREGFYKVQDSIETKIESLAEKIDARLERMEIKIDATIIKIKD